MLNIKYENIFIVLYVSATFIKYACTLNSNLFYLILNTTLDILLGILLYIFIKNYRLVLKEEHKKRNSENTQVKRIS